MVFEIAIIRSSSIVNEPRVIKTYNSLSKKYHIIVLGWDRELTNKSYEIVNEKIHIKHMKLKAPSGKTFLIFYYPLFWIWIFYNLIIYNVTIIHACDLESLIPSYLFKILFSKKVVFDSFDRYAMAFIPPKYHLLYTFINNFENILAYNVDALISVSEERLSTFNKYKPKSTAVIMNCPLDVTEKTIKSDFLQSKQYNDFIIVYAGTISYERGLLLIKKAVENLDNISFIIAGKIIDGTINQVLTNSMIHYVGLLKHSDALELERMADVLPIIYDPSIPINLVANPNKLFEAMMLKIPVISNVCKDIVEKTGCGIVVGYNLESVKNAISFLQNNPSLKIEMGVKGRKAFEKTYNWAAMENKLLRLYDDLLINKKI